MDESLHVQFPDGTTGQVLRWPQGVVHNGEAVQPEFERLSPHRLELVLENRRFEGTLLSHDALNRTLELRLNGKWVRLAYETLSDRLLEVIGVDRAALNRLDTLKAPMPGLVREVCVTPGQPVAEGDALLILEAMKMENLLKAPAAGTVSAVEVAPGDAVEKNQVLLRFA